MPKGDPLPLEKGNHHPSQTIEYVGVANVVLFFPTRVRGCTYGKYFN